MTYISVELNAQMLADLPALRAFVAQSALIESGLAILERGSGHWAPVPGGFGFESIGDSVHHVILASSDAVLSSELAS